MGERHLGEFLRLEVLQCMSSVLSTEKEMPRLMAFPSSLSKSSWRRRMLPRYEREAAVRAKSSTYEISRHRGTLKSRGETYSKKRRGEIWEP